MRNGIIKKFAFAVITSSLVVNAHAVAPGFYMGFSAGPATNSASDQQVGLLNNVGTTIAKPKSSQFGSSIYMGYKMNQYAGFEGGIQYFSGIKYNTADIPVCGGLSARVRDFDVVGKGQFPISSAFDVFGKAGMAFTYVTTSGALNSSASGACGKAQYNNKIAPTVSIGASYNINQSWVGDITWTRIQVGGIVSNVDFFGLGFSYHFVDRYCGQFLCDS